MITELLKKTNDRLVEIKQEAYEKMRRRVRFTDFRSEPESQNSNAKIVEINENEEEHCVIVPVQEIHVDTETVEQMNVKKEEVV